MMNLFKNRLYQAVFLFQKDKGSFIISVLFPYGNALAPLLYGFALRTGGHPAFFATRHVRADSPQLGKTRKGGRLRKWHSGNCLRVSPLPPGIQDIWPLWHYRLAGIVPSRPHEHASQCPGVHGNPGLDPAITHSLSGLIDLLGVWLSILLIFKDHIITFRSS